MGEPHSETTSVFPAGLLERVRKINNRQIALLKTQ